VGLSGGRQDFTLTSILFETLRLILLMLLVVPLLKPLLLPLLLNSLTIVLLLDLLQALLSVLVLEWFFHNGLLRMPVPSKSVQRQAKYDTSLARQRTVSR
jgi:hypothetical protein